MLTNKINTVLLHPVNKHISKFFYRNQMHYNYISDEKIMKTLIHKNILPSDPNKVIKLIIYYNKFKTLEIIPLPRLEFCKKPTLYINLNVL